MLAAGPCWPFSRERAGINIGEPLPPSRADASRARGFEPLGDRALAGYNTVMPKDDSFGFNMQDGEFQFEVKGCDPSAENQSSAYLHVVQHMISEARLSTMEKDGELSPEEFCAGVITALVEAWDEARGDYGEGAVPLLDTLDDMLATLKAQDCLPTHVTRSGGDGEELEPTIESNRGN